MAAVPIDRASGLPARGGVTGGREAPLAAAFDALDAPVWVIPDPNRGQPDPRQQTPREHRIVLDGTTVPLDTPGSRAWTVVLPPTPPSSLGDPGFRAAHGVGLAYVGGAMANGIASVELVEALARERILSFFGAAGLTVAEVGRALDRLSSIRDLPHGVNLIHAPGEPRVERELVELVLRRGVPAAEASAFLDLTPAIVRFRVQGVRSGPDGAPVPARRLMAKVSRREVARRFLSPPPEELLALLVRDGEITEEERALARRLPMCDDLTAEADSGGHTDNRPLVTLLPSLIALRDEVVREGAIAFAPRVGAAGGIGTPWAAQAALTLGAAYLVVGSVHQACLEAGTSPAVREALALAESTDVAMAPAADMFEMGVELQVLRRGTMFPMRARQLLELYRRHDSWEAIPEAERRKVEQTHFRSSFEEVWAATREFFLARDPAQVERAASDPRHQLALVFRWYLGLSSAWANRGEPGRQLDYQIWCGPSMGAFNEWVSGTPLAAVENRRVTTVAHALMEGAARLVRAEDLRRAGIALPPGLPDITPRLPARPATPTPARSPA